MRREVTTRQFFDGNSLYGSTRLTIDGDIVVEIADHNGPVEFDLVSPGLIDLQMNGFEQWDVASSDVEGLRSLDQRLCDLGTTSWLGTVVTRKLSEMTDVVGNLHRIHNSGAVPGFCGIHLEGPFLGRAPGAHRTELISPIDHEWLTSLPSSVRIVTLAAEQPDVVTAIRELRERGIVASIGHSMPTREEFDSAIDAGASMVTHLFNGMSGIHHREDGLALMALLSPQVFLGLIADVVHVSRDALALVFLAVSEDRIVLVSDSIGWQAGTAVASGVGMAAGAPRLSNGTLAGSSTPLAQCVAHLVTKCSVPLSRALRAATSTPASLIERPDLGRIVLHQPADLVAFDSDLRVVATMRRLPSTCA